MMGIRSQNEVSLKMGREEGFIYSGGGLMIIVTRTKMMRDHRNHFL